MISVPDLRRLALIGDSVFAVSITLNARAVTIPRLGASGFDSPAFGTFVEGVISVLLSVVVACLFWLGHWRYFRHVRKSSVALIAAHFTFLLALILLPISTDLFATNRLNPVATLVYGLNLLLLSVVALVFRVVAVRHSPGRALLFYDWLGLACVIALFTLSVALSLRWPFASQVCWYVGLAAPLLEAWLSRRIVRHQRIASS
jgi:uncharacterized membrane protein